MNGIDDENHSRLFFRQSGSEEASRLHGNDSHATTRTNCLVRTALNFMEAVSSREPVIGHHAVIDSPIKPIAASQEPRVGALSLELELYFMLRATIRRNTIFPLTPVIYPNASLATRNCKP